MVYLLLYVDDIILTAYSTELLRRTISVLQLEFAMSLRGGGGGYYMYSSMFYYYISSKGSLYIFPFIYMYIFEPPVPR
jgi:hypothetical protein